MPKTPYQKYYYFEIIMLKENQWIHGNLDFIFPRLPDFLRGNNGCRLEKTTFDTDVGEEVHALYLEKPEFVAQFEHVDPFNLFAHNGVIRTPHGIVAFIIWVIAVGTPEEVTMEQYLNPQSMGTYRIISSAAYQTHFKLLVVNNETGKVSAMVDFENVFGFDKLLQGMAMVIGHEPEGDFAGASNYVMENFSVASLIAASI